MREYLSEKGIEYDYYDISKDKEVKARFYALRERFKVYDKIIAEAKFFGIPALFYRDQVVIGFDKERIDKLLEGIE